MSHTNTGINIKSLVKMEIPAANYHKVLGTLSPFWLFWGCCNMHSLFHLQMSETSLLFLPLPSPASLFLLLGICERSSFSPWQGTKETGGSMREQPQRRWRKSHSTQSWVKHTSSPRYMELLGGGRHCWLNCILNQSHEQLFSWFMDHHCFTITVAVLEA